MTAEAALEGWDGMDTRARCIVMAEIGMRWTIVRQGYETDGRYLITTTAHHHDFYDDYWDTWPGTGALLDQAASEGYSSALFQGSAFEGPHCDLYRDTNDVYDQWNADAPTIHEAVCLAVLRVRAAEEASREMKDCAE